MKVILVIDGQEYALDLSEEFARDIAEIAAQNGLSFTAALQQAISNEKFLGEQEASGAKILIEKDDKLRYLEREPAVAV